MRQAIQDLAVVEGGQLKDGIQDWRGSHKWTVIQMAIRNYWTHWIPTSLSVTAAPKRRARVFVEGNSPVPVSRGRFQALSSDDELGDRGEHEFEESQEFDMTVADSVGEDETVVEPTALTQWESGVEFSLVRGSGFTLSADVVIFSRSTRVDLSHSHDVARPQMRRLVLIQSQVRSEHFDSGERESDARSMSDGADDRDGLSEVEGQEEEFVPERAPVDIDVRARTVAVGMGSLDMVDIGEVFRRRAVVVRTVPVFLRGAFKAAFRVALEERLLGEANGDLIQVQRAWKLFMSLPRMILFRPPRGGKVLQKQLEERCQAFALGDWVHLVRQSMRAAEQGSTHTIPRRRRQRGDDVNRRAARALRLVQLGEASSVRQALEGAELAPGTLETLNRHQTREACGFWCAPLDLRST